MEFEVEILDDIYEVDRILDAKRKVGNVLGFFNIDVPLQHNSGACIR